MPKLVIDIETVGENFDELDNTTQEVLTHWIKKESESEDDYQKSLEELKGGLGFSPLTGQIVAIGLLDVEKDRGEVYYQAPGEDMTEAKEGNFELKLSTEKEMLVAFWNTVKRYNEFITFNGRGFDIPFIIVRSAAHKIKIARDLMEGRYLYQQKNGVKHIDLFDQLTHYGAMRRKGGLHLWCRAFGIESPKSQGVTGDDVARLFQEKKYLDIAKYNTGDLIATKELYEYWKDYICIN